MYGLILPKTSALKSLVTAKIRQRKAKNFPAELLTFTIFLVNVVRKTLL